MESHEKEPTLDDYHLYFDSVELVRLDTLSSQKERLREHRISISQKGRLRQPGYHLRLLSITRGGMVANYQATVEHFRLRLTVLHLDAMQRSHNNFIGSGGFGEIYQKSVCSKRFVAKVISYSNNHPTLPDITEIIRQVVMCKLCSFLKIGPQIETSIPFDLICYPNKAQFHMEKCEPLGERFLHLQQQMEKDLRMCLKTLHSFHLVHRDIKPANILWNAEGRFVLTDFGLTMYVNEEPGEESEAEFAGTSGFVSPALLEIKAGKRKKADLYLNDYYAFKQTLRIKTVASLLSIRKWTDDQYGSQSSSYSHNQQFPVPTPSREVQSYEYYKVLFAATSFFRHEFNLKENWQYLSYDHQNRLLALMSKCYSLNKIRRFLAEMESLELPASQIPSNESLTLLRQRAKLLEQPETRAYKFTADMLALCERTLGNHICISDLQDYIRQEKVDFQWVVSVVGSLVGKKNRLNSSLQPTSHPFWTYLSPRSYQQLLQLFEGKWYLHRIKHEIYQDLSAMAHCSQLGREDVQYLTVIDRMLSNQPLGENQLEGLLAQSFSRLYLIYWLAAAFSKYEPAMQKLRLLEYLIQQLRQDDSQLQYEHAVLLMVRSYLLLPHWKMVCLQKALYILESNEIEEGVLHTKLLSYYTEVLIFLGRKQQAREVLYAFEDAREHYGCSFRYHYTDVIRNNLWEAISDKPRSLNLRDAFLEQLDRSIQEKRIEVAEQMLEAFDKHWDAGDSSIKLRFFMFSARVSLLKGMSNRAIEQYDRALSLGVSPSIHLEKANCHAEMNHFEQAIKCTVEAIGCCGQSQEGLLDSIQCYDLLIQFQLRADQYQQAVWSVNAVQRLYTKIKHKDAVTTQIIDISLMGGVVFLEQGHPCQALASSKKAIRLLKKITKKAQPNSTEGLFLTSCYTNVGICLLMLRQHKKAVYWLLRNLRRLVVPFKGEESSMIQLEKAECGKLVNFIEARHQLPISANVVGKQLQQPAYQLSLNKVLQAADDEFCTLPPQECRMRMAVKQKMVMATMRLLGSDYKLLSFLLLLECGIMQVSLGDTQQGRGLVSQALAALTNKNGVIQPITVEPQLLKCFKQRMGLK